MNTRATTNHARGSALVLALVVVVIVGSLGLGYLRMTSAMSDRQADEVDSVKAFYLCEAGLAEAFQAVRVGRTGQLASEEAPALYGDGLLWVDAVDTPDSQVRLTSTALVGTGRSSLSLVVEPVEIPLGFFSEEDLVVDTVLLVDGYDSSEGDYDAQDIGGSEVTLDPGAFDFHVDSTHGIVFESDTFYRFSSVDGNTYTYDASVTLAALSAMPEYMDGTQYDIEMADFYSTSDYDWRDIEFNGVRAYFGTVQGPEVETEVGVVEAIGSTTGEDGLLASNGDVVFQTPDGESIQIFGEVIPGPEGTVQQIGDVTVTGSTDPRATVVELPEVEVPEVVLGPAVTHDDLLPMVVPTGESGHSQIVVAKDAELVLRGPSTVVIGDLVLEPGARMTLDTRDGDVALYVTQGMDLQPGSIVENTVEEPSATAIQVSEIASDSDGAPVKLNATSEFHGTIYAPDTEVDVGGDFEVFGGIVARKLNVGAGARLHFDRAEVTDSPIPKLISWKIVELPATVAGNRGNPFTLFGVDRETAPVLGDSHDLDFVHLLLDYTGHNGTEYSYSGFESEFDWTQVASVDFVAREAMREYDDTESDFDEEPDDGSVHVDPDDGGSDSTLTEPPPGVRDEVFDLLYGEVEFWDAVGSIDSLLPFGNEEWSMVNDWEVEHPEARFLVELVRGWDESKGGTGGR